MRSLKRKFKFGLALLSFTAIPGLAHADFCELLVGESAPSCRVNASNMGATIIGNWLRLKPETAVKGSTGKKGKFSSATVPAYGVLGVKPQSKLTMTVDCFAGDRAMRITALPYMLGLTNGKNSSFNLTFKIDQKPSFKETWPLRWQGAELEAPSGSRLLSELSGAQELIITTDGIVGNKSQVGYVYKVDGFDKMNAGLCL